MAEWADDDHTTASGPGDPPSHQHDEWVDGGEEYPVLAFIRERRSQIGAEDGEPQSRLEELRTPVAQSSRARERHRLRLDRGIMRPAAGVLLAAIIFLASGLVGWGRYGEDAPVDPLQLGSPGGGDRLLLPTRVEQWEPEPKETEMQIVKRVVRRSEVGPKGTPIASAGSSTRSATRPEAPEPRTAVERGLTDDAKSAPRGNKDPEVPEGATGGKQDEDASGGVDNDDKAPPADEEVELPEAAKKPNPEPPAKKKDPVPPPKKNPSKGESEEDGED